MQIVQTPTSSNISRFAWDGTNLYIEFKSNGKLYKYPGVSEQVYRDMCHASSVGSFFHQVIKKAHDCQVVEETLARSLGFEEVPTIHA
ncbi:MAG: KTSC domain-containing protein [Rhodococcus sp. (in: high G+C Gram-positive bacteria)]